jgi:hypothetical protein
MRKHAATQRISASTECSKNRTRSKHSTNLRTGRQDNLAACFFLPEIFRRNIGGVIAPLAAALLDDR